MASPDSAQQKGRFCFFVADYLLEVLHIFKTKKDNRIYGETHERGYDLREYELQEYELRKQHTLRGINSKRLGARIRLVKRKFGKKNVYWKVLRNILVWQLNPSNSKYLKELF